MLSNESSNSKLVLGWKVNSLDYKDLRPEYWSIPGVTQGEQADENLFLVDATSIAQHTAVIAQSGSGKSFFMGRLIEEILLRTRAKCLIFDPNADFRRVAQVADESLWTNTASQDITKIHKFTHEKGKDAFEIDWNKISKIIYTGRGIRSGSDTRPLQLWWPDIPAQILAQDLTPFQRNDFHYCHETLDTLGFLLEHKSIDFDEGVDLFDEARKLFRLARAKPRLKIAAYIERHFGTHSISKLPVSEGSEVVRFVRGGGYFVLNSLIETATHSLIEKVIGIKDYVSENVQRYYFGKARLYQSTGILEPSTRNFTSPRLQEPRLKVIDLPSLDENVRIDAIGALLKTAWDDARNNWENANRYSADDDTRVPNFIVVDEAHNLIPSNPNSRGLEALREEFRRIVAEGRKFGLFLIFVTQRPDKLDPFIFSECENKVIMRLGSDDILNKTIDMLGIKGIPSQLTNHCLNFGKGRALMIGKWTNGHPEIIYAAARRTVEGGRDLNPNYWAVSN